MSVDPPTGGGLTFGNLTARVQVLSDGAWVGATNAITISPGQPAYAYIGAITANEVKYLAGVELETNLRLQPVDDAGVPNGDPTLSSFRIRKPPIVLVHGYNADGSSWSDSFKLELYFDRGDDFVRPITYSPKSVNTPGPLDKQAQALDDTLEPALKITRLDLSRGGPLRATT